MTARLSDEDEPVSEPARSLSEQLPLLLRGVWRTAVRVARTADGQAPLPDAQIEVLHTLASRGPLSPTALAQTLQLARPTVSNLVREMTARGLLERWRSIADGRAALFSLTAEAESLMASVHRRRVETFERALAALPDEARHEIAAAMPALEQLQQRLEEQLRRGR
jgi:DNA-binding MarR family transcriptional regulator